MSERTPLPAVAGLARTAKLPPPPTRRPRRVPVTEPETPVMEQQAEQDQPDTRKTGPVERRKVLAQSGKPTLPMRSTSLTLPVDLIARVRERARSEEISQADLLLDAISATQDSLDVSEWQDTQARTDDGLFVRTPTREQHGPVATLSLRLRGENLQAIDGLVERLGAPSRSALCAAALRTYLAR